jgi:hypothetical protein
MRSLFSKQTEEERNRAKHVKEVERLSLRLIQVLGDPLCLQLALAQTVCYCPSSASRWIGLRSSFRGPCCQVAARGDVVEMTQLLGDSSDAGEQVASASCAPVALVGYVDRYGYTALMHAAKEGHVAATQLLIDRRADLNMQVSLKLFSIAAHLLST